MRRFIAGLIVGVTIGATAAAYAAVVVGNDGTLSGWSVTKDGEEVCTDPSVAVATKEIECD